MSQENQATFAVVQLTRLGDIIQSTLAARELKRLRPEIRLILIARKQFSNPLRFLVDEVFDETYELDFKQKFSASKDLTGLKEQFSSFITQINQEKINVLVNQSFSKSSQYLCSLIESEHKIGLLTDQQNSIRVEDPWSQLIYSVTMDGPLNPFNLVDIYQSMLGTPAIKAASEQEETKEDTPHQELKNIVLCPFTSHEKKHWNQKKWVEILFKLLKEHPQAKVSLIGAPNERELASTLKEDPLLKQFSTRISNMAGETSLKELHSFFKTQDLFIGHDSMSSHLSKFAGLRTLTFALGTVRPQETFPYGMNSYVVAPKTKCYPCFPKDACSFFQCHTDIPYQAAYATIDCLLKIGTLQFEKLLEVSSPFYFESISIYESCETSLGLQKLKNINPGDVNYQDVLRDFYRIAWLFKLSEVEEKADFPQINRQVFDKLLKLLGGLQHLYELSEFGKKYSRYILQELSNQEPSLQLIKDYSAKIDEIDRLKQLIKESHSELSPIVNFSALVKSNLKGENLVQLTESSFVAYADTATFASVMYELVEKTLEDYKKKHQKRAGSISNNNEGVV